MSARAFIDIEDVPSDLRETAAQRIDDVTGQRFVSFPGCPLVGESSLLLLQAGERRQIEYQFPRGVTLRTALFDWFMHHGINFTVIM